MNRLRRLISNKAKLRHSSVYHVETLPQTPVQNHPSNYSEPSLETGTELKAEDPHPNENAYTPRLPAEIWLQIINLIEGNMDKLSLSRVSSVLRALVLPSFKTVNLFPNEGCARSGYKNPDELNLLLSLRGTQLASVVTSFTIKLTCTSGWKLTGQMRCMCLELNGLMSTAFKTMVNMLHLDIHCRMCYSYGIHRCFTYISTRRLLSLSFRCYCESLRSLYSDTSIAPAVLATVESLRWYCKPGHLAHPRPKEQISSDPNTLSRVNALVYCGGYMEDKLMATRSIRRVLIPDIRSDIAVAFLRALSNDAEGSGPIGLTGIILEKFDKLEGMISVKPGWFEGLQHIGTLPQIRIDSMATQIESYLASFSSLPYLKSLDTVSFDATRVWNSDLLGIIRGFLKGLRKVLVRGDVCWVWEFAGGYAEEWSTPPGLRKKDSGEGDRASQGNVARCVGPAPIKLGMNRLRRLLSNNAKRRQSGVYHGETLPNTPAQNHPSNYSEPSLGTGTELEAEDPPPNENAYIPRLPAEIWLQIVNLVEGNGDKLSLSRVSTLFRALVLPSFKTIDLFSTEGHMSPGYKNPDEAKLLFSLRGTHFASVVTSFTIKLTCNPGRHLTGITRPLTCMCLELDDLLSTVFKAMVNLVHLDIYCRTCCSNATHSFPTNISARRLRSLSFQCRCRALASLHLDTSLPPAVLATLESLRWDCVPLNSYPWPKEGTLTNPNTFLKLNALVYSGSSIDDKLIATRHVRRVWVLDLSPGTEEAFVRALSHDYGGMVPVGLECVIFTRFLKLGGVVAANPRWFENLWHIGTLPYVSKDSMVTQIESYLTPFTSLPYLKSLDTASYFGAHVWSLDSLMLMRRLLRTLRRVLVRGDTCRVCEFVGGHAGQWRVREVPTFGCWDIIRGACD